MHMIHGLPIYGIYRVSLNTLRRLKVACYLRKFVFYGCIFNFPRKCSNGVLLYNKSLFSMKDFQDIEMLAAYCRCTPRHVSKEDWATWYWCLIMFHWLFDLAAMFLWQQGLMSIELAWEPFTVMCVAHVVLSYIHLASESQGYLQSRVSKCLP